MVKFVGPVTTKRTFVLPSIVKSLAPDPDSCNSFVMAGRSATSVIVPVRAFHFKNHVLANKYELYVSDIYVNVQLLNQTETCLDLAAHCLKLHAPLNNLVRREL